MQEPHKLIDSEVEIVVQALRRDLIERAVKLSVSESALRQAVAMRLMEVTTDNRSSEWRARLFLFSDVDAFKEPIADSDDGLPLDAPGVETFAGLPAVADWVAELAGVFHQAPCAGLDSATLRKKVRSVRVQMSHRQDGTGRLTADYTVLQHKPTLITRRMRAVCLIVRAGAVENERPPIVFKPLIKINRNPT